MCASGRYNESQMTGSGSLTSLVLPLPHQSEVQTEPREIVAQDCLPPEPRCPLPAPGGASATGSAAAAGSGLYISAAGSTATCLGSLLHVVGSRRRCNSFSCMSSFSLDFRESKPKFKANSFSFMAEITPHHYESRYGNTRDVREPDTL